MPENKTVVDAYWQPMCKPFCRCDVCENDIHYGNDYYDFDGDIVCEDCEPDYVREHFRRYAK